MAKDMVTKTSQLPAHLQKAMQAKEAAKEFSGGVQSGFPVLSYRGKVWRVKQGGEEQVYTDEDGDAIQSINVVLIRSNENLSKTYYKGKYSEGDNAKPDCWSATGIKPDPNVPNPVSSNCQGCPMNQWGSRVSDEGKKQKACADVRRMAVIFEHELEAVTSGEKDLEDADCILLRVPGSSLNPLKDYVEKTLLPKGGILPYMLVTRVGFDSDAAYPRFTFKGMRFLDEEEFGTVEDLRESDIVKRIVNEAAEMDDGGNTDEDDEAPSSDHAAKSEAAESAPPESIPTASTRKKRAAAVEEEAFEDDEDDEEEAPPPPPKPAKKKRKKKVKASEPPDDSADAASDPDDLEGMLDSILG
jgi:hypothetical protein